MSDLVLCQRCETLEKHGIKRRDLFYSAGPSDFGKCKQCHEEKIGKILKEYPVKTLEQIRRKYGKSSKGTR